MNAARVGSERHTRVGGRDGRSTARRTDERSPGPDVRSDPKAGVTAETTVVLVNMPFGKLPVPPLGLALIQAVLRDAGIRVRTLNLHLEFARRIGVDTYGPISDDGGSGLMPGEWVFSAELFPMNPLDTRYLADVIEPRRGAGFAGLVASARSQAARFLDEAAEQILALGPRVVGFTSLFQQHVASLALARRLRARRRDLGILLGGANCEGETGVETARSFPFLDAVFLGEADEVVAELVRRMVAGRAIDDLPGVLTREGLDRLPSGPIRAPRVVDLDALPIPDYGDFFERYRELVDAPAAVVPFETSRGCWWGAKHHCVFCGLNPDLMPYRRKSPSRAVHEIGWLAAEYPGHELAAMDNILDPRYFDSVLPQLAALEMNLNLFFEVKANLKPVHVKRLRAAGVRVVQPGVESFVNATLERMDKGVTAAQNVSLLASCETFGVRPFWILIRGFPGETEADVARTAALFRRLTHLTPPASLTPLQINRFSPHFRTPAAYGLIHLRPTEAYSYVYPLTPEAVANLAYYFSFEYADEHRPAPDGPALSDAIDAWREHHARTFLFYVDYPTGGLVADARGCQSPRVYPISPVQHAILRATTEPRRRDALSAEIRKVHPCTAEDFDLAIQELDGLGLVLVDGEQLVSLALRWSEYIASEEEETRTLKHEYASQLFASQCLTPRSIAGMEWAS